MKIILLDELKGRGGEGDVIDVATGYAVNYLLPRKIAIPATKGNLKQLELRKHNIAKRETNRLDSADKLVATLEGKRVRIGAKVGEEGQLFGSITPAQVAAAIAEKFGVEVERRRIDLHGIIKTAGEHTATVSVYREVKATVIIEVVDEKVLLAEAAAKAAAKAAEADAAEVAVEAAADAIAAEVAAAEAAEAAAEAVEAEAEVSGGAEVAEVAVAEEADAEADSEAVEDDADTNA